MAKRRHSDEAYWAIRYIGRLGRAGHHKLPLTGQTDICRKLTRISRISPINHINCKESNVGATNLRVEMKMKN
jgi:hypothetical protein